MGGMAFTTVISTVKVGGRPLLNECHQCYWGRRRHDGGAGLLWVDGMPFIDSVRFAQGCSSMHLPVNIPITLNYQLPMLHRYGEHRMSELTLSPELLQISAEYRML